MPVRGIDSGRPSPRALESAPIMSGVALKVSVKHGHRAEAEIFDGLKLFSNEVERIAGITDEDITAQNISVAVLCLFEKLSGMFKRR